MIRLLIIALLLSSCATKERHRATVIENFDRDAYFETKVREDYIKSRSENRFYGY